MSLPGTVSRADLLVALACGGVDAAAQGRRAALIGFRAKPKTDEPLIERPRDESPPSVPPRATQPALPAGEPAAGDVLQARLFGVTKFSAIDPAAERPEAELEPSTALELGPRDPAALMPFVPLVRAARLWPAVRRSVAVDRPAGVDWARLCADLARARNIARLPRRSLSIWSGELMVVLDRSERMQPYQADFQFLLSLLLRLRGRPGLALAHVDGRPDRVLAWQGPRGRGGAAFSLPLPAPGTVVLVLSDCGSLARDDPAQGAWLRQLARWKAASAWPVCWVPAAAAQIGQALAKAAAVHCLVPAASLRRQRGQWSDARQQAAEFRRLHLLLDRLLTLASCTIELDPPLLRSLRNLAPELRNEPALEALYWTGQPLVRASLLSRPLASRAAAVYRPRLAELPASVQQAVLAALHRHHASLPRSTEVFEVSLWQAHARAGEPTPELASWLAAGRRWRRSLVRSLAAPDGAELEPKAFARDLLARQSEDLKWQNRESEVVASLWAWSGAIDGPPGVSMQALMRARQRRRAAAPRPWTLLQRGDELWLAPAGQAIAAKSSVIEADCLAGEVGVALPGRPPRVVAADDMAVFLLDLQAAQLPALLSFDDGVRVIDRLDRPHWAVEWARDADGVYALAPAPWAGSLRLERKRSGDEHRFIHPAPQAAPGLTIEADEGFGLAASLTIAGATQRLRWIAPGEFMMGSPEDEPGRDNESPRHRVGITQGYWLAESACSVAVWHAVMGGEHDPAQAQLPKTGVSFDDVQAFLQRLQARLPAGCSAALPTEAEWEYACRAGTATAFHFGARIGREQVNFDASKQPELAVIGEAGRAPLPVKSLPPNTWGLYEMHGNVWEWCADDQRDYAATAKEGESLLEPTGPVSDEQRAHRAVRGGAWFRPAGRVRSAARNRRERGFRNLTLGFRVALRSTGPGALEGPQVFDFSPEPEAQGPARRDAGPARSWMERVRDIVKPKPPPRGGRGKR